MQKEKAKEDGAIWVSPTIKPMRIARFGRRGTLSSATLPSQRMSRLDTGCVKKTSTHYRGE